MQSQYKQISHSRWRLNLVNDTFQSSLLGTCFKEKINIIISYNPPHVVGSKIKMLEIHPYFLLCVMILKNWPKFFCYFLNSINLLAKHNFMEDLHGSIYDYNNWPKSFFYFLNSNYWINWEENFHKLTWEAYEGPWQNLSWAWIPALGLL